MAKIILFIFLFFASFNISFANNGPVCEYKDKIDECKKAIKNGTISDIEDFECINTGSDFLISYQIVLDEKFKVVDKKLENYIKSIELNKDSHFTDEPGKTPLDKIDEISLMLGKQGPFFKDYMYLCGGGMTDTGLAEEEIPILEDAVKCEKVSNFPFFDKNIAFSQDYNKPSICQKLAIDKLEIYKNVAYNIFLVNKMQVRNDQQKTYYQGKRESYEKLLDKFVINLRYLDSIAKGWTRKTKNPH